MGIEVAADPHPDPIRAVRKALVCRCCVQKWQIAYLLNSVGDVPILFAPQGPEMLVRDTRTIDSIGQVLTS